jgi:hypothetical protein
MTANFRFTDKQWKDDVAKHVRLIGIPDDDDDDTRRSIEKAVDDYKAKQYLMTETEEQYQQINMDLFVNTLVKALVKDFGVTNKTKVKKFVRNVMAMMLIRRARWERKPLKRGHPFNRPLYVLIRRLDDLGYRATGKHLGRRKTARNLVRAICEAAAFPIDDGSIDHTLRQVRDETAVEKQENGEAS